MDETGERLGDLEVAERPDRRIAAVFAPRVDIVLLAEEGVDVEAFLKLRLLTRADALGDELVFPLLELTEDDKDFFGLITSFLTLFGLIFLSNSFSSTFPTTDTSTPSAVTLIGSGLSLIPY